jgi:hypothetical protein
MNAKVHSPKHEQHSAPPIWLLKLFLGLEYFILSSWYLSLVSFLGSPLRPLAAASVWISAIPP